MNIYIVLKIFIVFILLKNTISNNVLTESKKVKTSSKSCSLIFKQGKKDNPKMNATILEIACM